MKHILSVISLIACATVHAATLDVDVPKYQIIDGIPGHEYTVSDQYFDVIDYYRFNEYQGDSRCVGGFSPCAYDFPNVVVPPVSVPEPSTLLLSLIAMFALWVRRRI